MDVVYGDLESTDSILVQEVAETYTIPIAASLGEVLFALHTYFALVSRLIAVELLAISVGEPSDTPTNWRGLLSQDLLDRFEGLERGKLPGGIEISNLFEADVFSWWAAAARANTGLLESVQVLLDQVDSLAFPQLAFGPQPAQDVLRDLYQSIVPRKLRKSLGEFLTPGWLATACTQRMGRVGANITSGRVIDPTCGTGTFIVPILSARLRALRASARQHGISSDDVQRILDSVAGIDLNPIAVTATRVNYVLSLGELAQYGKLTLPVWRADSLVVPTANPAQGALGATTGIYHLLLNTSLPEPFTIPASMDTIQNLSTLRSIIDRNIVEIRADSSSEDIAAAAQSFEIDFRREFEQKDNHNTEKFSLGNETVVAVNLFNQIAKLTRSGRDAIWAKIIENSFAPVLAGQFDVVIGNPPWLSWTKLPKAWRKQTEALWRTTGLWRTPAEPGEPYSTQTSDIATLVFAVSLMRYAKPGGYVGLLTPSSLITADPGSRAFRKFHLQAHQADQTEYGGVDMPFAPIWVDDWSAIQPFAPDAANKPIFLVTHKGRTWNGSTRGAEWTRPANRKGKVEHSDDTRQVLHEEVGVFTPINPSIQTSAWRFQARGKPALIQGGHSPYSFGTGLHTRGANGIYFVTVKRFMPPSGSRKASVNVTNIPSEGRDKNLQANSGRIEADLVYPLLRGRDIAHWVAKPSAHIVIPHAPREFDHPLTESEFRNSYPDTHSWLSLFKRTLSARKVQAKSWNMEGSDWCRLEGTIAYSQTGHVIVVREFGSRPAAAIVHDVYDPSLGGLLRKPMVDHKAMLCSVDSREEALYYVAMFNSTPLQDLLESFVNPVAVSPSSLRRLPIPLFDSGNEDIVKLAAVADLVDTNIDTLADHIDQIDALVLSIIGSSEEYSPQPQKNRRSRQSNPVSDSCVEPLF